MKRLSLLLIFVASPVSAAALHWGTSTVPDAWHGEVIERAGYFSADTFYTYGTGSALNSQSFWEANSKCSVEMGLGNGVGFSATVPYKYQQIQDGRAGGGAEDYLLGFSKQVAYGPWGTFKSSLHLGLPGAYGVGTGVGMDHTFRVPLVPDALFLLGHLDYYYPLLNGVRFSGDRLNWGAGFEWRLMPMLDLSLEAYGRYAGLVKDYGQDIIVDYQPILSHDIVLAPGLSLNMGGFTLQGGVALPISRQGTTGANPDLAVTLGTIWDF